MREIRPSGGNVNAKLLAHNRPSSQGSWEQLNSDITSEQAELGDKD